MSASTLLDQACAVRQTITQTKRQVGPVAKRIVGRFQILIRRNKTEIMAGGPSLRLADWRLRQTLRITATRLCAKAYISPLKSGNGQNEEE